MPWHLGTLRYCTYPYCKKAWRELSKEFSSSCVSLPPLWRMAIRSLHRTRSKNKQSTRLGDSSPGQVNLSSAQIKSHLAVLCRSGLGVDQVQRKGWLPTQLIPNVPQVCFPEMSQSALYRMILWLWQKENGFVQNTLFTNSFVPRKTSRTPSLPWNSPNSRRLKVFPKRSQTSETLHWRSTHVRVLSTFMVPTMQLIR